jgi:hypothetical protein
MDKIDKVYNDQINFLEDFFGFHPEYLAEFTTTERRDLSTYFFTGREVNVANIFEYRHGMLQDDPDLQSRAEAALLKLWRVAHIEGMPPLSRPQ